MLLNNFNMFLFYQGKDLIEHWYQESEKYKFNSEPDSIQGIGNLYEFDDFILL